MQPKFPGGRFITIQVYCMRQGKSQLNNLTLYLRELEKEQAKHKVSRRKEIIKVRAEIKKIETKEK